VAKTAQTVESLFGVSQMRVAVDDRTNSLVVFGKQDSMKIVEAVLLNLDKKAEPKSKESDVVGSGRSYLVRVFWLSEGSGQMEWTAECIPGNVDAVLAGLSSLGIERPQLIAQTATSLTDINSESLDFRSRVSAVLMDQEVNLAALGSLRRLDDERIGLDLRLEVTGATMCDVQGSLAMPMGHFMILGTTCSVIHERSAKKLAEATFNTPRSAFVVQVVEAESYSSEKGK
jgi:hypothetical protein